MRKSAAAVWLLLVLLSAAHAKPSDAAIRNAILWARSCIGQTSFPYAVGVGSCPSWNMCSGFVANAYGYSAASTSAYILWCLSDQHPGDWDAPPGSLVFFSRSPDNGLLGHVGLSTGNGNLIQGGYSKVKTGKLRYENAAPYLGWAWPPLSWPGRSNEAAALDLIGYNLKQVMRKLLRVDRT